MTKLEDDRKDIAFNALQQVVMILSDDQIREFERLTGYSAAKLKSRQPSERARLLDPGAKNG